MQQYQIPSLKPKVYYIIAIVRGRPFIDGWYATKEEAQKIAWRNLQGVVFDIVESDTRDRSKFTQNCKHQILEQTGNIEEAIRPVKHQI